MPHCQLQSFQLMSQAQICGKCSCRGGSTLEQNHCAGSFVHICADKIGLNVRSCETCLCFMYFQHLPHLTHSYVSSRTSSTLRDVVDTSAHGGGTEGICLVSCRGQGRMALVPALEQDDTGDTKQVVEMIQMVQRLDHCGSSLQFH